MLKKLAAVVALLLIVGSANAAYMVWNDEFSGAANTSPGWDATKWKDTSWTLPYGTNLTGNGTGINKGGGQIATWATFPLKTVHTYEFSYRYPDFDPANADTSFNAVTKNIEQPVMVWATGHGNQDWNFGIRNFDSCNKIDWWKNATGSDHGEISVPVNAYYSATKDAVAGTVIPNYNTAFQNIKVVLGPSYQSMTVNGVLIYFTRFDLSASTEQMQLGLKAGGSVPTGVEYDYVRVWTGDTSGNIVPGNVLFADEFAENLYKKPSDGMRIRDNYWSNDGGFYKLPGFGFIIPSDAGVRVRNTYSDGTGRVTAAYPSIHFSDDFTLETALFYPQGIGTANDQYDVLVSWGQGDGGEGDNKVMLRQGCGGTRPLCLMTRDTASGNEVYTNIWGLVNTWTTGWTKVNMVYEHLTGTVKIYLNDSLALTKTGIGFDTTQPVQFVFHGASKSDQDAGTKHSPAMDYYRIYQGYWVPVELSSFDVE